MLVLRSSSQPEEGSSLVLGWRCLRRSSDDGGILMGRRAGEGGVVLLRAHRCLAISMKHGPERMEWENG